MLNLGILISGRGSNLKAIIKLSKEIPNEIKVVAVVSNNPDSLGVKISKNKKIPTEIFNHREFSTREKFEKEIDNFFQRKKVNLICNAGFMRILTESFVNKWFNKIINIHPSLLPSYPGLNTHSRAIKDGVKFTGCTVHFVRSKIDTGPIINQAVVPIETSDTEESLNKKVLKAEHLIYPMAIKMIARKKISINKEKIIYEKSFSPKKVLFNPEN